nr:MAG TPA: hypothetical protein [Caudoviricetes sp.]
MCAPFLYKIAYESFAKLINNSIIGNDKIQSQRATRRDSAV